MRIRGSVLHENFHKRTIPATKRFAKNGMTSPFYLSFHYGLGVGVGAATGAGNGRPLRDLGGSLQVHFFRVSKINHDGV